MDAFQNFLNSVGSFLLVTVLPLAIILVAGILLIQLAIKLLRKALVKAKLEKDAGNLIVTLIQNILYG